MTKKATFNTFYDNRIDYICKSLQKNAKEDGDIEFFDNAIWYFGSEVATLRLALKYKNLNSSYGFSPNLDTYYFKIELNS